MKIILEVNESQAALIQGRFELGEIIDVELNSRPYGGYLTAFPAKVSGYLDSDDPTIPTND